MDNNYQGSCLCGAVEYKLAGQFQSFYLCYCQRCQKGTGSAHAANLFARAATLTWIKGQTDVQTYQHPNSQHRRSFCQKCGSAVPTIIAAIDSVMVPSGSLDTEIAIKPTAKIYVSRCANWLKGLDKVLAYSELPEKVQR